MKNTKTKIILSTIIFLSVVGFVGIAGAAGTSLYVSPASLTKTVGDIFSVSVGFNASGSKVCVVEGTLVFNNLTCQSITVADDVMAQSLPTCSAPHFLIGIPNCTTSDKTLLTLSVKAGNAGTAFISLTGVDIIGEGVSVGSASISGNYTINAVSTSTPISALTPTLTLTPTLKSKLTPKLAPTPTSTSVSTPTSTPASTSTPETITGAPSEGEKKVIVVRPEERQIGERGSFLAAIGSIVTFGTGSAWVGILVGLVIFAIVVYMIYARIHRKRKNSGKI